MKYEIQVSTTINLEFDEKSEEFKQLFEAFNEVICKCDYEGFATHIAEHIARYGVSEPIEGVGYVQLDGRDQVIPVIKTIGSERRWVNERKPGYVNLVESSTDLNGKMDFFIDYIEEY